MKKLMKILAAMVVLALACTAMLAGYVVHRSTMFTDEFIDQKINSELLILYENGERLDVVRSGGGDARKVVEYEDIPQHCHKAIISAEDKHFGKWWHLGVDPIGFTRAQVKNLQAGKLIYGGSGIHSQVVKNLIPRSERGVHSVLAKLLELVDSLALAHAVSDEQVLEIYWNNLPVGAKAARGIGLAAQYFFSATVDDLSLGQCQYIAGQLNKPARYDYWRNTTAAQKRTQYVHDRMAANGYIRPATVNMASLRFQKGEIGSSADVVTKVIVEELNQEPLRSILRDAGIEDPLTAGLVARTTLDERAQKEALKALSRQVQTMGNITYKGSRRNGAVVAISNKGIRVWVGGTTQKDLDRVMSRRQPGSTFKALVAAAYFTLKGEPNDKFENIEETQFPYLKNDGGVYEPGADHDPKKKRRTVKECLWTSENICFVNVLYNITKWLNEEETIDLAKRLGMWPAAGNSAKKHFVSLGLTTMSEDSLAEGFDMAEESSSRRYRACARVWPERKYDSECVVWDRDFRVMLGLKYVVSFAHALGVESPLAPVLSLALGSSGITQLDGARLARALTTGYAMPVGLRSPGLSLIKEIRDSTGNVLWRSSDHIKEIKVLPYAVHSAVAAMEMGVISPGGTGRTQVNAVRVNGRRLPWGGKTGTTNESRTCNFHAIVPRVERGYTATVDAGATSVAAYIGYDKPHPQYRPKVKYGYWSAGSAALPIVAATARALTKSALPSERVDSGRGSKMPLRGADTMDMAFGGAMYKPVVYTKSASTTQFVSPKKAVSEPASAVQRPASAPKEKPAVKKATSGKPSYADRVLQMNK